MKTLCGLLPLLALASAELVVNVKLSQASGDRGFDGVEDGHDRNDALETVGAISQKIEGNSSTETVTIEYVENDGTVVTQLTDFRKQSQMVRVLILGEEELNQPQYQALCFISSFTSDLIPPEAVMKLRQKNPDTIRIADEDLGDVVQDSPLLLNPQYSMEISSHLSSLCKDAKDHTFTSQHELYSILTSPNVGPKGSSRPDPKLIKSVARNAVDRYDTLPRCFTLNNQMGEDTKFKNNPKGGDCICLRRVWLSWFPCALKYCRNKDTEGEHRCGIKTCRKCLTFRYPVQSREYCAWDEP